MNKEKSLGIILATLAAILFGVSSITAKYAYGAGGNTFSVTLVRNMISLPLLAIMAKMKGTSLKVEKKYIKPLLLIGLFGGCLTALGLYSAYKYISVGLTLCLHYCYPALVVLIFKIFYKEKIGLKKSIALVLSLVGIWIISFAASDVNIIGVIIALGSGLAYAFYLLVMDKSGIRALGGLTISFYNTLFASVYLFIANLLFTGGDFSGITLSVLPWIAATGFLVACLGNSLVPEAVKRVGPTTTGILGILEPCSSVFLCAWVLGDPLPSGSALGAVMILVSAVILATE